ncbi:putative leader peptide [Streptomyces glaucosporus]
MGCSERSGGRAPHAPRPPFLLTSRRHIDLLRVSSAASPLR